MNNEQGPAEILHVEDNPHDAALIKELLRKGGVECRLHGVMDRHSFTEAFQRQAFDLILCDFSLPGFNGLDALEIAKSVAPEIPFVFVSAMIGEELAVESLKRGAADYILKDRLGRLPNAIKRALSESKARREQRRVHQRLEEQGLLLEHASDAILLCSADFQLLYANRSACAFFGGTPQGDLRALLGPSEPPTETVWKLLVERGTWAGLITRTVASREAIVQSRWTLLRTPSGEPSRILISETDITEEKTLERSLIHAQRMESIGTLAAGVAHDVNNSLTPIVMGLDLLAAMSPDPEALRLIDIMRNSAGHCAHLVSQIVTFARGDSGSRTVTPLGPLLTELIKILSQVFPKTVQITPAIPKNLSFVVGDTTKLHQALMNLCVNARDAMPSGGKLAIRASNAEEELGGSKQPCVRLEIQDTGSGIKPEHAAKIFEPFFTTKSKTGGTGLGLPMVKKIIEETGGSIRFQSVPGRGTTFILLLPASQADEGEAILSASNAPAAAGELILVVEDELSLAQMASRVLADAGYQVLTANDGASGLAAFFQRQHEIDLIITDLSMPYLDGARMLSLIRGVRPEIPAIVCSGLLEPQEDSHSEMILKKPFTAQGLLKAAADALAASGRGRLSPV